MDKLLTTKEIADYLDLNEVTVRRKATSGEIPSVKVGRHFRFNKLQIDQWLLKRSSGSPKRILVIDDNPMILQLFRDCLRKNNYEIYATSGGMEALDLVNNKSFDLIFLDLIMPEIFGNKVFLAIKEIDKDVPIAIITGYPDSDLLKEVIQYGPFLVLNKPFTCEDILRVVQTFNRNGAT